MAGNNKAVSTRVATLRKTKKHPHDHDIAGDNEHNLRTGYIPKNVDQSRIKLNSGWGFLNEDELEIACLKLRQENSEGSKRKPKKMRKDAALAVSGIITFGTNAQPIIDAMGYEQQDELYEKTARKIADFFNTDLTGIVAHRDESAPHAHYQLMGYDRDGQPVSRKLGAENLRKIQDLAHSVYQEFGIERGYSIEERLEAGDNPREVRNRTVKQLHQDLPREKNLLEKELADTQKKLKDALEQEREARHRAEKADIRANIAEERLETIKEKTRQLAGKFGAWISKIVKKVNASEEAKASADLINEIDYEPTTRHIRESSDALEERFSVEEGQRITSKIRPK